MAQHGLRKRSFAALALGACICFSAACGDDGDDDDSPSDGPGRNDGSIVVRDAGGDAASSNLDAASNIDAAGRIDAAAVPSDSATGTPGDAAGDTRGDASAALPGTTEYALAKLDPDMRKVIDALQGLGAKSVSTLSVDAARTQPSVADAVKKVLQDEGKSTEPEQVGAVAEREIPRADQSQLKLRVYTPAAGSAPFPVIVYFHGGGWVIATLDTYDASARALANAAGAVVVSVDYRKGPENKFPAAHDDAYTAYRWVLNNAAQIDGKANSVAVAGESAGGNLAANVVLAARGEQGIPLPVHALLVYPVATTNLDSPSYVEYANAVPLDKPSIPWFTEKYLTPSTSNDGRINLVSADFAGFPRTTIINAQLDPLRSDGDTLFAKLKADNVTVEQRVYDGVTHEFFGTGAVVGDAKDALQYAAGRVKSDFKP